MKKKELVAELSRKTCMTHEQVEDTLYALQDIIVDRLCAGDSVQIWGFLDFKVNEPKEITKYNPKTGKIESFGKRSRVVISLSDRLRRIVSDSVNEKIDRKNED